MRINVKLKGVDKAIRELGQIPGQAATAMTIAIRKSLVGARRVILEEIHRRYNAPAWWVRKAIDEPSVSERKEP